MKTTRTLMTVSAAAILGLSPVLTGCKQDTVQRTGTEDQIDQNVAEHVKAAFSNSPAFKFPDVQVSSFKGKVQLSGFVLSDDQKSSAETIAKGIPGVVDVENKISLKQ